MVDYSSDNIDFGVPLTIAEALKDSETLKSIRIVGQGINRVKTEGCRDCKGSKTNNSLIKLDLSKGRIDDEGAIAFAEYPKKK